MIKTILKLPIIVCFLLIASGGHALWQQVGGSLNNEPDQNAINPDIGVDGNTVYITWQESYPDALANTQLVFVKQWNGTMWESMGNSLNASSLALDDAVTPRIVIPQTGNPWVAFDQYEALFNHGIYVKEWSFDRWNSSGVVVLNYDVYQAAVKPAIASYNSNIYVAWQEDDSVYQRIRCSYFDGINWSMLGDGNTYTAINQTYAEDGVTPVIAISNSAPYIAWTQMIGGVQKIVVSRYNGYVWEPVGNTLNIVSTDNAYDPTIIDDDGTVIVGWCEDSTVSRIYVKAYQGSSWSTWGSALNIENAYHPDLSRVDGTPYIAWSEESGGVRKINVSAWDGSSWITKGSGLNIGTSNQADNPKIGGFGETAFVTWEEETTPGVSQIVVKYDITATATVTPTLTVSATYTASATATPTHTPTWTKTSSPTISPTSTISPTITHTATITQTSTQTITSTITPWVIDKDKVVAFPMPATGESVNFYYSLESAGTVKISIYDLAGRKGKEIKNDYQTAGRYVATWDISAVSPGIYVYMTEVKTGRSAYKVGPNKLIILKEK